jgi:hypothetical protein
VVSIEHIYIYKRVKITIKGYDMEVNVKPLKLCDFDLIIGIDWFNNIKLTWIFFKNY